MIFTRSNFLPRETKLRAKTFSERAPSGADLRFSAALGVVGVRRGRASARCLWGRL